MKRLTVLTAISNDLRRALQHAETVESEMTDKQKETWNLQVTCFLQQAQNNVRALMAKVKEKAQANKSP